MFHRPNRYIVQSLAALLGFFSLQLNADTLDEWEKYLNLIEYTEQDINELVQRSTKHDLFFLVDIGLEAPFDGHTSRVSKFISILYVSKLELLNESEKQIVAQAMINLAESVDGMAHSSIVGAMIQMRNELLFEYATEQLENPKTPWVTDPAQQVIERYLDSVNVSAEQALKSETDPAGETIESVAHDELDSVPSENDYNSTDNDTTEKFSSNIYSVAAVVIISLVIMFFYVGRKGA